VGLPVDRACEWVASAGPMKPFSQSAKSSRNSRDLPSALFKQRGLIMLALILNAICRQFPEAGLPGMARLGGKAMTEIVVPLLAFLSISVFLAHAFDAYRTG
jgi:hypothetical protein